jgi:predicted nucleotidyltransferase
MSASFDLRQHTIVLAVAGSRCHGLARPASDVDLRGVAVPPLSDYLSLGTPFAQADDADDMRCFLDDLSAEEQAVVATTKLEGSVFSLQKVMRLASDCNPHILEPLFCREQEIRRITPVGQALRDGAPRFLSKRARHSFGGYASAQLKRIQNHRAWLLDPPTAPPTREEFGLPEVAVLPREQLDAARAAIRKQVDRWELDFSGVSSATGLDVQQRISEVLAEIRAGLGAFDERTSEEELRYRAAAGWVGLDSDFIDLMARERRYHRARQHWKQYTTWKRKRNPERAALEAAYGYDTKHGAHLVRLLTMAVEIVETGEVHVWRGDRDAEQLQGVRAGEWPYDDLIAWTEQMDARLNASLPNSPLPDRPDHEALDSWAVELTSAALGIC